MQRFLRLLPLLLSVLWRPALAAEAPRLVVVIAVDQFRYDYLLRFAPQYEHGLRRLLDRGAVFTNAFLDHYPTVTASGHATILTGATPAVHGIVGNSWYDRETGRMVTSVSDPNVRLLGAEGSGASPWRLQTDGVGDKLKARPGAKVIGISIKDRAAILTAGRSADAAYWYHPATGRFVSSTWYMERLPDWVAKFNSSGAADRWLGKAWIPAGAEQPSVRLPREPGRDYYGLLRRTPYANELVREFAEQAVRAEKLGEDAVTDLLAVSFSANDYVGHRWGPDSPEVRDISIATDRTLGRFLDFLDAEIGLARVLVVFTADHGVAPVPEQRRAQKRPGGRIPEERIAEAVERRLTERYGEGKWVVGHSGPLPYLNHRLIAEKGLDLDEVRAEAARAARNVPHVSRVYTYGDLAAAGAGADAIERRLLNGFHRVRGADLFVVAEPFWIFGGNAATHGSPHAYDAHIPLILMGPGIRPGRYREPCVLNDLAPTLAALLEVGLPAGSAGRVLEAALAADARDSL